MGLFTWGETSYCIHAEERVIPANFHRDSVCKGSPLIRTDWTAHKACFSVRHHFPERMEDLPFAISREPVSGVLAELTGS